jgi:hypothetical protein
MKRWSWLGMLLLVNAVAAHAADTDGCTDCKASALANASQCQAVAAPDPALREKCEKDFNNATFACREGACRLDAGGQVAGQCAECLKQSDVELKKCATMPAGPRAACEARAAGLRKGCDERLCPAPRKAEGSATPR